MEQLPVQRIPQKEGKDVRFIDYEPAQGTLLEEVIAGLSKEQKSLPAKFLYDERGSTLFDEICELPEYYPTRTEEGIMRTCAPAMAERVGAGSMIVEYGSGSSRKTTLLLDALEMPRAYIPVDISREHLLTAAQRIGRRYPTMEVVAICADYTQDFAVPEINDARKVAYFPGSTIGNFEPRRAVRFLKNMRKVMGQGGGALIGVDLRKPAEVLLPAYADAEGVTAAFNKNVLRRLQREFDADLDPDAFEHQARFNEREGRIEMHLVASDKQTMRLGEHKFEFERGESIHTENSYKFTQEDFRQLARTSGWSVEEVWTDEREWFSVQYLERAQ